MVEVSRRMPVRGPTFIRLIARIADIGVAPPEPSLSDRLGQWIDWTRAVALSRALDGTAPDGGAATPGADTNADECRRALVATIVDDPALASGAAADVQGFAGFRKLCLARQRAMQAETGRLRGRLRDRVAACSPGMARLAEVDAAMEQVLSPKEHALLASIPDLLAAHYERLQQQAADATPPRPPEAWLAAFRRDMRDVLLAELDVRFQPIEGLLAALRQH